MLQEIRQVPTGQEDRNRQWFLKAEFLARDAWIVLQHRTGEHQGDVLQERRFSAARITDDHQLVVLQQGGLNIDCTGIILFGLFRRVFVEHDAQPYVDLAERNLERPIVVDPGNVQAAKVAIDVLVVFRRRRHRTGWAFH